MSRYDFNLLALTQTLDNGPVYSELLFFPEFSTFGLKPSKVLETLERHAVQTLEELPALEIHRRLLPRELRPFTLHVEQPPLIPSPAWKEPVLLTFHALRWTQGKDTHLAWLPQLGIEAVGNTEEELYERLMLEVPYALQRRRSVAALMPLVWLQRCEQLEVNVVRTGIEVRSPKERAILEDGPEKPVPVLTEVCTDMVSRPLSPHPVYERQAELQRLADAFLGRWPRSVLLVGPSGVGKTALVQELVRRRIKLGLAGRSFYTSSGSRLIAGQSGFGMWEQRCQRLCEEATEARAILHLGPLVELMQVGRHSNSTFGIASFLRPWIARGDLLVIVECTPEQLPVIEREDPQLYNAFLVMPVEEPKEDIGRSILLSVALEGKQSSGAILEVEVLETVDRLHRRYATYSAWPGRPLRFLRNLLHDRKEGVALTSQTAIEAFSRETGLPAVLLDDQLPLPLEETRGFFASRVIGQEEAVGLVVDLIATVKAALNRPRRPIASLLFIGPTGVGKTQMARSLAEFLFHDVERLIRFDMSEYADPWAVERLIGSSLQEEGLLTRRVREQPFSVVLLDEFEKAHPLFFDLLLQVLGEGRLTDGAGRVADFTNSVIIMTSNLGAASYGQDSPGFARDPNVKKRARDHFVKEVQAFVRPELYNRMDRVVPFSPLDKGTVHGIARREIQLVQARDGIRHRDITLEVGDEVCGWLAEKGFDPKYGARPLKRVVERELLAPLADRMNRYGAGIPLTAQVSLQGNGLQVVVKGLEGKSERTPQGELSLLELVQQASDIRRRQQALARGSAWLEKRNELGRLRHQAARIERQKFRTPKDEARLARLERLSQSFGAFARLKLEVEELEERLLLALYGKAAFDGARQTQEVAQSSMHWLEYTFSLLELQVDTPDQVVLALYGKPKVPLTSLAMAYLKMARQLGHEVTVLQYVLNPTMKPGAQVFFLKEIPEETEEEALPALFGSSVGVILGVSGPSAWLRFGLEAGMHSFKTGTVGENCLVEVVAGPLAGYAPPRGVERADYGQRQPLRRTYLMDRELVEDEKSGKRLSFSGGSLATLLATAIEETLLAEVQKLFEP